MIYKVNRCFLFARYQKRCKQAEALYFSDMTTYFSISLYMFFIPFGLWAQERHIAVILWRFLLSVVWRKLLMQLEMMHPNSTKIFKIKGGQIHFIWQILVLVIFCSLCGKNFLFFSLFHIRWKYFFHGFNYPLSTYKFYFVNDMKITWHDWKMVLNLLNRARFYMKYQLN